MQVFSLEEWERNFDELFSRVENGETIGIMRDDGQAAVMMPADDDDIVRIHTEQNNDAS
jgi:antitoxin (DNA-binding transcriptional repressor) of toxin-antitoxin stability system|tara:strand:- start:40 stop:216 length:177 start_codon:yes stop_codon:yes gene_type:complete